MTVREEEGATLRGAPDQVPEHGAAAGGPPGSATVAGLLADLDGLESLPLAEQAERLETVRKGLDEALAAGTRVAGHG